MKQPKPLAALLPALFTLSVAVACSPAAPHASASPPRPSTTTAQYVVGADPRDDACARVVSAIGFAGPLLRPPGQENRQSFDEGVRGRLAYVEGVVSEYGPRLPAPLLPAQDTLRETTHGLAPSTTPLAEQIRLLKDYRSAADTIVDGCPRH
ncbi:hypothetical protein Pth03_24230 [Planotetraspora thailandica]|uniref:Lipoprotein n=1 Tax=Planotetraspora thailandica TaxID=487172 RepID=A0A8J3XV92_9ACTN|nr:hypothetical protein [Planotetraspora thailandica]GII54034.1 hypothetical protein Pth03_24230 [Planotetraspora thailandica]